MNSNNIKVYLNTLRQKGNLAYEYNPFHNYQTDVDLSLIDNKFLVPRGLAVNIKNGELLTKKTINELDKWVDKRGNIVNSEQVKEFDENYLYAKAGSLIDLDTDKLNFDLEHPVDITIQPSYDGSVNLILNDDKNIPRLINSRFSVREKGTYEIVDRIGENDTNVYNSKTFDKDTSLYFLYNYNPIVRYERLIDGSLQVGQYCFYFTYCDSDNNESDYIAETGLIPIFLGTDGNPFSMSGGIKNETSNKGIRLRLENIDKSYNYLKIYYIRYFADYQQNRVYECKKIYQKYSINSNVLFINITGKEEVEDIDANILNISHFNPKSILTQAQCKNMLFFGNIVKNSDNYKELLDCALRIVPQLKIEKLNVVDNNYNYQQNDSGYYNTNNIYYKTGYFDLEYYRFGVVFIYNNGTLSNVYNVLGGTIDDNKDFKYDGNVFNNENEAILTRNYIKINDLGWIKNASDFFNTKKLKKELRENLNSKGVCKIDAKLSDNSIIGIKFEIPEDVINLLKDDLGIRGLFFVRQKCIPNILAQCYLLPMDEVLTAPVIQIENGYRTECFLTQGKENEGRLVNNNYEKRLYKYDVKNAISNQAYAAICPDFLLNQPYYNQIFNGNEFKIRPISEKAYLTNNGDRFYKAPDDISYISDSIDNKVTICSVTDDVPSVVLKDKTYKLEIGKTEEVFQFKYAGEDLSTYNAGDDSGTDKVNEACNLVRGKYSPYLAIYSEHSLQTSILYNIYSSTSVSETQEYLNRMNSSQPFYSISDRYNFENLDGNSNNRSLICWRGDCYINTFTYRLNRNFNDPSLPNNDKIIDSNTWKNNYDVNNPEGWSNIYRSDVNAVRLGSWITFKVRSSMNYALRSEDHSYVSEKALMGTPRSYYPKSSLLEFGENKIPDSYLFNDAFRATLGFKCYFALDDINYIKNTFSNRIQYSSIAIQDSFKNNYRESLSIYFRDYSQEYGGITKLIGFEGHLLVVLEHAIGIATVNERILAGTGDGEPVFINTKNVLPEELTIISDTIGSQWSESVIKSEAGYVYGVDTIAKKIWRVQGQLLEILSDFRVNKFLVDNISLGERENSPIVGLRNVKTHYNNNKKDIMFTFYDDVYKDEEKVWNLCFNELLNQFITFYSWVPSYSENIDTQFFSFNRETSKFLTLLNKCNYSIEENVGVLVDNPVISSEKLIENKALADIYYFTKELNRIKISDTSGMGDVLYKEEFRYLFKDIDGFKIEHDHWNNYKLFEIKLNPENNKYSLYIKSGKLEDVKNSFKNQKVILLTITPIIKDDIEFINRSITLGNTETIAITLNDIIEESDSEYQKLTNDFYLHGQAGLIDIKETLRPTYWYGEYHPFEFEFVVNDKIGQQKIFENLVIISNKAEPESFHFEIEGDNYEFSEDKRTMYFRLEATKNLYLNLGSDMLYDRDFTDVIKDPYTYEQYYRTKQEPKILDGETEKSYNYKKIDKVYPINSHGFIQLVKSTIFPLHYERIDTYNNIYDKYTEMTGDNYDFKNLSGSEIKWDRDSNQFDIVTHIKNSPIDLVGRLRGNSRYKEGKWNVQIPSIVFNLKNESIWKNNIPPIVINSSNVPKDLTSDEISMDKIPNIYTRTDRTEDTPITEYINVGDWTYRKEARIRDKWMKVKVRYSGKNLAVIHSLITLYNISYS